jgi:5-methylthioribose kinase
MAITTAPELEEFLKTSSIPAGTITPLTGGITNFVWRLRSPEGQSTVIKHAEPFVRGITSMSISTSRMDFEYRALTILPDKLPYDNLIQLPKVYAYDSAAHILQLADAGSRTLKEAYGDYTMRIPKLGNNLGGWLARLHAQTRGDGPEAVEVRRLLDNPIAKANYRHVYASLVSSLSSFSLDAAAIGEQIDEKYGSLLATDADCVCHGDFWPENILVDRTICYGTTLKLSVVDWEIVRVGCGATDVGQFAAEAWLLDRFRGGRGLFERFLEGYRDVSGPLDDTFLERVGAHFGSRKFSCCWSNREAIMYTADIGYFRSCILANNC